MISNRGRFIINRDHPHEGEQLVLNFHQRVHEALWPPSTAKAS
jgi:hypothetical protein